MNDENLLGWKDMTLPKTYMTD